MVKAFGVTQRFNAAIQEAKRWPPSESYLWLLNARCLTVGAITPDRSLKRCVTPNAFTIRAQPRSQALKALTQRTWGVQFICFSDFGGSTCSVTLDN